MLHLFDFWATKMVKGGDTELVCNLNQLAGRFLHSYKVWEYLLGSYDKKGYVRVDKHLDTQHWSFFVHILVMHSSSNTMTANFLV